MNHPETGLPRLFIKPGELCFSREPLVVTTILGSCVALTMFHQPTRIGALCHALLPSGPAPLLSKAVHQRGFRYVDSAFQAMVTLFERASIPLKQVKFKLFGGGDVLAGGADCVQPSVGQQNLEVALNLLAEWGMFLTAQDTGGNCGRKVRFFTHTGDVLLKRMDQGDPHGRSHGRPYVTSKTPIPEAEG